MKPAQHPNAFAYVIHERSRMDPDKWIRSGMFYADDPKYSSRDACWEFNIAWRDPENIRVVPLFDEAGNDAMREANLDEINARYMAETMLERKTVTLADAVETELKDHPPQLERFAGLLKTLQAFDSSLMDQLLVPPNTVQRAEYLPSVEQLESLSQFTEE